MNRTHTCLEFEYFITIAYRHRDARKDVNERCEQSLAVAVIRRALEASCGALPILRLLRHFVNNRKLDTLALGERDQRLVTRTDREHVGATSGKLLPGGILQVHDFKAPHVLFAALDDTNATGVTATSDHAQGADVELDRFRNLVRGNVNQHGIVLLDHGIRVTNGAAVVQADARHTLVPELLALDLAQLVLRFNSLDAVDDEATLVIVDQTEVFVGLFDRHDICETSETTRDVSLGFFTHIQGHAQRSRRSRTAHAISRPRAHTHTTTYP